MSLDERLSAAFRGLDARADFDARFMARLHAESQVEAAELASARRLERERYVAARMAVVNWRHWTRSVRRFATLETVGILTLIGALVATALSQDQLRQYGPTLLTAAGVLVGLAPVITTVARRCWARTALL